MGWSVLPVTVFGSYQCSESILVQCTLAKYSFNFVSLFHVSGTMISMKMIISQNEDSNEAGA